MENHNRHSRTELLAEKEGANLRPAGRDHAVLKTGTTGPHPSPELSSKSKIQVRLELETWNLDLLSPTRSGWCAAPCNTARHWGRGRSAVLTFSEWKHSRATRPFSDPRSVGSREDQRYDADRTGHRVVDGGRRRRERADDDLDSGQAGMRHAHRSRRSRCCHRSRRRRRAPRQRRRRRSRPARRARRPTMHALLEIVTGCAEQDASLAMTSRSDVERAAAMRSISSCCDQTDSPRRERKTRSLYRAGRLHRCHPCPDVFTSAPVSQGARVRARGAGAQVSSRPRPAGSRSAQDLSHVMRLASLGARHLPHASRSAVVGDHREVRIAKALLHLGEVAQTELYVDDGRGERAFARPLDAGFPRHLGGRLGLDLNQTEPAVEADRRRRARALHLHHRQDEIRIVTEPLALLVDRAGEIFQRPSPSAFAGSDTEAHRASPLDRIGGSPASTTASGGPRGTLLVGEGHVRPSAIGDGGHRGGRPADQLPRRFDAARGPQHRPVGTPERIVPTRPRPGGNRA